MLFRNVSRKYNSLQLHVKKVEKRRRERGWVGRTRKGSKGEGSDLENEGGREGNVEK